MQHESVCGVTRSGKSHYATARGREHPGPVLVIDPQDSQCWPWPRAGGGDAAGDVFRQAGRGVVFVPSDNDKHARAQVAYLIGELFARAMATGPQGFARRPWLVLCDEAQVYAPQGGPDAGYGRIARRGLRWGIEGCFISQRPQDVSKAVLSQCTRHVIFWSEFQTQYWQRYGIPGDQVQLLLELGRKRFESKARPGVLGPFDGKGPWPYVVWEGGRLSGPFHE